MYTILTTCPDFGSRNVGDRLIEARLKEILLKEKGSSEAITFFREVPLDPHLDEVNACRAILMPCAIRDTPMYPKTYRLTEDLHDLRVPVVPMVSNWNVYPGDRITRDSLDFSRETRDFLHYLSGQFPWFSCREHNACAVLHAHGVHNTLMTGDTAMFCLEALGRPMRQPARIESLVFSPPLSPFYGEQAVRVMEMLAALFPAARRYCAFHLADALTSPDGKSENSAAMRPEVAEKNRVIREAARGLDFEICEFAGQLSAMAALYDRTDLHVGYECHAHLYFLSIRSPSVLLAEDARGIGFNYSLGGGGLTAFQRAIEGKGPAIRKSYTSGYCTSREELAIAFPKDNLAAEARDFLREELSTGFRRYLGIAPWLDETYEKVMRPYIRSLP